ncbi:MAG: 50S ribosomal protein L6 [Thiotrichales bacterium]|nr:MAG: 50S ribosomal protein L6 [Thiotrichales bacterium]
MLQSKPIVVPEGVKVVADTTGWYEVSGPRGVLKKKMNDIVKMEHTGKDVFFKADGVERIARMHMNTVKSILNSMIIGVQSGFSKTLVLLGVGYKAILKGNTLVLTLGFSHPIEYTLPAGVKAVVSSPTKILIEGMDKQLVGQVAAEIRSYRPPENYKGKGVRYENERVRIKEVKKK